jgi:hypothetical protein
MQFFIIIKNFGRYSKFWRALSHITHSNVAKGPPHYLLSHITVPNVTRFNFCLIRNFPLLQKNDLTEPIVIKDEDDLPSKILVHEKEDEEYFEITIKRKTPENCPETFIEFPETVCEDGLNSDHTKRVVRLNIVTFLLY